MSSGRRDKDIEDISKVGNSIFRNPFSKNLPESGNDKLGADTQAQELKMPQVESSYPLFVAKYDCVPETDDKLGFKKGELLYVISTRESDWWFARVKHSGCEGYIPSNFVADLEVNSLGAEE